MKIIITTAIFIILLLSFISTPAPVNIEISDMLMIVMSFFIGVVSIATIKGYYILKLEYDLLFAISLYISYLLISALLGLVHGVSLDSVARSIGPNVNFIPLILMGFISGKLFKPWSLGIPLILIGLLQCGYHFYLYLTTSLHSGTTLDVLIKRITLIDPRTSIPLYLAVAILPLALFFTNLPTQRKKLLSLIGLALVLTGLFAGIVTLTRAIILSIVFGWTVFINLYLYYQYRLNPTMVTPTLKRLARFAFLFALFILVILYLPAGRMLFSGIIARFYNYSPLAESHDYSNGRLYDEWLPAFQLWQNSDITSHFFGVGAGNAFTLLSGEEHAYTHNLSLYSLLYGGFYGLIAYFWLYITTFKTLVARAFQTRQTIYLAYAALLSTLFFYVQLFAVYKLLAFNAMLFLILALALSRPTQLNPQITRETIPCAE